MQSFEVSGPLLGDADIEARQLGHSYVAPEHLLIALSARADGNARAFLSGPGLQPQQLRDGVAELVGPTREPTPSTAPLRLALRTQLAIADAIRIAKRRGESSAAYDADDLLVAVLGTDVADTGVVGALLGRAGLTPDAARKQFAALAAPVT